MKIGLDIHGVIDSKPKFYSNFSKRLVDNGHEVHIITGISENKIIDKLKECGIVWTHFYSITDYHISIGSDIERIKDKIFMNNELWNRSKADYCERAKIDIHFDDSEIYGKYFGKTIYVKV